MAKRKEEMIRGAEISSDGNRAINKFRIGDALMMLVLVILCLTGGKVHFQQFGCYGKICVPLAQGPDL